MAVTLAPLPSQECGGISLTLFCVEWSGAALPDRDAKARTSEAVVVSVDVFDFSGLSDAVSRVEEGARTWAGDEPYL